MRIISRGKKPEEKMYKGTCSSCKTVFECQQHEGKLESDLREGTDFLRVSCPVCGKSATAYERNDGAQIPNNRRPWNPGDPLESGSKYWDTSIGGDGRSGGGYDTWNAGLFDR
jgi:hypothetical protein